MEIIVDTPQGPGRLVAAETSDDPVAVMVLGHGSGGGIDAFDLEALADHLPQHGVTVVRYSQPWRESGRKVAVRPEKLDEAWEPAVAAVTERWPDTPLFVGGRSAGARVACRWAAGHPVAGVVALSFPLHPPGKPESSRIGELSAAAAPAVVVQGEGDPFGRPEEVRDAVAGFAQQGERTVVDVPDALHGLNPHRTSDDADARIRDIVDPVVTFVRATLDSTGSRH